MVIRQKKPNLQSYTYLLLISPLVLEPLVQTATGTSNSHQRTKPEVLLSVKIPLPTAPILEKFEATVMPLLSLVLANRKESTHLAATRDLLLPRLLSGELTVKEAAT
jgi:type I restriction enzyme S subunit